jgi:anti-sigma regulatory factor (Ser/Thr protein kinase)
VTPSFESRAFSAGAESVREARDFVRNRLFDTHVDIDDAVLLTSELASNAVTHARSDYRVTIRRSTGAVRIEFHNDAPEMVPMFETPSERGGRGMRLVESISSRWGTESAPDHKIVWFELPDPVSTTTDGDV